jgi:hypothetical protein
VSADDGGRAPGAEAGEAALAALPQGDAAAAYRLAVELESQGLTELALRAYEQVIAWDPEHAAARRALGYELAQGRWLRGDDLMRAKGFVHHQDRWMTAQEFAEATRPEREAAEQKAGEERVLGLLAMIAGENPDLVREARRRMATEEDRFKLAPLAKALRCNPVSLRLYVAEELGRLANPLAVPALLKRAIDDPEPDVRAAVVDALREIGEPSTVHPLGRALESRYEQVRVRAAQALGRLGDEVGAAYVIKRWELRSGDFPRAYFAQLRQISYIQDFDVEVAQTSFIADPVVGVLQEGVVQDVKIHATVHTMTTVERVAYDEALQSLSRGEQHGGDVRAWSRWWNENERRLLEERAQRYERIEEQRRAGR